MELANKIIEEYSTLEARMEALKDAFGEILKDYIEASFTQLQQQAPEIQRVSWTQGTPSFNDGEPCYFSVHEPEFFLEEADEESWLYTSEDQERAEQAYQTAIEYSKDPEAWASNFREEYKAKYNHEYRGPARPYPSNPDDARDALETIKEFRARYSDSDVTRIQTAFDSWARAFWAVPEEVMRTGFGDGARVTLSSSGIDT
jgi:hypothetical protein